MSNIKRDFDDLVAKGDKLISDSVAEKAAAREALPAETIVRNAIKTPDGTILISRGRHDYMSHEDENGERYVTDGGRDYLRRSVNNEEAEDLSVMLYHGHEKVREAYDWGTYGPDGDQELSYVLLKDMDEGHMQALIDQNYPNTPLMMTELRWRQTVVSRKMVRKQDIERLMVLKDKYSNKPAVLADLDEILEDIVEKFNSNEFNGEPI